MKKGRFQCKDIPALFILKWMWTNRARGLVRCTWFQQSTPDLPSLRDLLPVELFPDKLVLAKMGNLIRRGLVSGCVCGCRGDFTLTDAGISILQRTGWLAKSLLRPLLYLTPSSPAPSPDPAS